MRNRAGAVDWLPPPPEMPGQAPRELVVAQSPPQERFQDREVPVPGSRGEMAPRPPDRVLEMLGVDLLDPARRQLSDELLERRPVHAAARRREVRGG